MEIMMKAVHERMEWVRIRREMKTMMIISRTTWSKSIKYSQEDETDEFVKDGEDENENKNEKYETDVEEKNERNMFQSLLEDSFFQK